MKVSNSIFGAVSRSARESSDSLKHEFDMHGEYRKIDRPGRIVHTIAFRENTKLEARNPKQIQITNDRMNKRRPFRISFFEHLVIVSDFVLRISNL